ncbi:signal recognition particle-docking protein FtsY [Parvibaculum sedimenti]|uniref:Signal recognition particle receptor FtsY n=1 Tax=Parvibaculum sedimenti TaxID=2608632 RepID=A0A6N6VKN5_9HYPH|nr:signal recognition particle-docking protein FtsY [Parvibaculum sedimenti]KAB7742235.1 signal recognition particle-docking protein FtsY [Parvibaculum sedimenti]
MSETGTPEEQQKKKSFFQRMKDGLSRSTRTISDGITGIFIRKKLDRATLDELEELLIAADLGIDTAASVADAVGKDRYDKEVTPEEIRGIVASEISKVLAPVAKPFAIDAEKKPFVVLMVGVNGAGKTTTAAKIAAKAKRDGKSVMLAAGDTFRAAAVEQLKVWGERIGVPVVTTKVGGDAAGLAYEALARAKEEKTDLLLIDTAGRLQNKADLMAELEKIVRVLKKLDPEAPHATLLVLDATTGQNAVNQVEIFGKIANVTGLVMTKLDGTARGGILVAIAQRFGMPVHLIGIGEGIDDLQPFDADTFARAITGAN